MLYGLAYPVIAAPMGVLVGWKAFIAAVVGGIGNLRGAVLGGFILGAVEIGVAAFLLKEPPLPFSAKGGYALLAAGGVSLLPDWARSELGIPMPRLVRPLAQGAGRFGVAAVRWGMAGLDDDERLRHGDVS